MGILDDVVTIDTGKTKRGGTWEPVVHNGSVSTSPSYHSRGTDEPVLLYDPDCGFCAAAADMLARLGPQVRIMAGTPAALEYYGVCADRFAHAIPLVNTRHHVIFGSDAIALTLRTHRAPLLRLTGWMLLRAPVRPLAHRAYRLIAENRPLISQAAAKAGAHWGESCSISPR